MGLSVGLVLFWSWVYYVNLNFGLIPGPNLAYNIGLRGVDFGLSFAWVSLRVSEFGPKFWFGFCLIFVQTLFEGIGVVWLVWLWSDVGLTFNEIGLHRSQFGLNFGLNLGLNVVWILNFGLVSWVICGEKIGIRLPTKPQLGHLKSKQEIALNKL